MDHVFHKPHQCGIHPNTLDLEKPLVMGILNITPDSFFEKSRLQETSEILNRVDRMVSEGVDIIDVGAVSTRPGSDPVDEQTEHNRLDRALTAIRSHYPDIKISLDTYRSSVASWAHENFRLSMVNDISGGQFDEEMFAWIATTGLPYVMMHIQGDPKTMQQNPKYENLMGEIIDYFVTRIEKLATLGFHEVIIDPGFGFGKSLEHNYHILSHLGECKVIGKPIMVGISRKSMIYRLLELSPEDVLNSTTALNMLALVNGADILRVHDVKEAHQCIRLFNAYVSA